MTKSVKITKEMILDAAFNITRKYGIDKVSNRELAKYLDSSIRPIYYQFKNAEELNKELYGKIEVFFYNYIFSNMNDNMPKYKQVGIKYIEFAKEEKEFFKVLFMTKTNYLPDEFVSSDKKDYEHLEKLIKLSTNLSDDEVKSFHVKMWMFTHGIACLVASEAVSIAPSQIQELLTSEFQALMLLEEKENGSKSKKRKTN